MKRTHYIALGPHCWGKSFDRKRAVSLMKRNWPTELVPCGEYKVLFVHAEAYVDGADGSIISPKGCAPIEIAKGTVTAPAGRKYV